MSFSSSVFMGTPGGIGEGGPESLDDVEIPGFPKAPWRKQGAGYAANLQGHLERLAANATSVSHILEALCGGLDRLEQKIDTNASLMEARLANIVHHVTGEADEDTMSAWGSLGPGSPGGDTSVTRRRSVFGHGLHTASFLDDPSLQLDEIGEESPLSDRPGLGNPVGEATSEGVVPKALAAQKQLVAESEDGDGIGKPAVDGGLPANINGGGEKDVTTADGATAGKESKAVPAVVGQGDSAVAPPESSRCRSNQDHPSAGDKTARQSANDSEFFGQDANGAILVEEAPTKETDLSESMGSSSDSRFIARQRWLWAFGRVCRLIRRRKRKQFEIMNQRATDRSVRMGSRVSIVEKRLDETQEALVGIERLRAKSTAHAYELKCLHSKVDQLSALTGVEVRVTGLVKVLQEQMEGMVKTGDLDVEAKLRSGHEELESRLEGEMKRHGSRLEDVDDRNTRSEDAVRHAEDRIGEMQEEMNSVTHSIAEFERQLRVDKERLDILESIKKAQQRRSSELSQRLETGGSSSGIFASGNAMPEPEVPEETPVERMSRLLKTAATNLEFLSTDLDKIVHHQLASDGGHVDKVSGGNMTGDVNDGQARATVSKGGIPEQLRAISDDAADYASRCRRGDWDDLGTAAGDEGRGAQVLAGSISSRAEALCARIEATLSEPHADEFKMKPAANSRGTEAKDVRLSGEGTASTLGNSRSLGDIQCPNGRRELPARLEAARDVLLPIVEEGTSVGKLKIALCGLKDDLERALGCGVIATGRGGIVEKDATESMDSRWRDIEGRLSILSVAFTDLKEAMYERRVEADGCVADAAAVELQDLVERLATKADVSWVQRELQRLWDSFDSRAMSAVASSSTAASSPLSGIVGPSRSSSAPSQVRNKQNPETAGEESDSSPPPTPAARLASASTSVTEGGGATEPAAGAVVLPHGDTSVRRGSTFHEGSPLIKDLLRKTFRLDQQMSSKADNEEVVRALSSIGNQLSKISSTIPGIEDALSNKVERKDLTKLAALISGGNVDPSGISDENNPYATSAVLASRLNSKFRCLSCDRPLPAIGPPGPPKLGAKGVLAIGASGNPPSQQRYGRPGGTGGRGVRGQVGGVGTGGDNFGPASPGNLSPRSESGGDVVGWGSGSTARVSSPPGTADFGEGIGSPSTGSKDGWKHRGGNRPMSASSGQPQQQPVERLEPIGANAPGEQIAGAMSRYPRMMPPPSRIRTAAGGGGAGLSTRPGSSGQY